MIKFKIDEAHDMKAELEQVDNRLRFLFMAWVAEVQYRFNYSVTVTGIDRTQTEQDHIYSVLVDEVTKAAYKVKPWNSVHQFKRGIDVSCSDMPQEVKEFTAQYFKQIVYDNTQPGKPSCLIHDVGAGNHVHLQVSAGIATCVFRKED